MYYYRARWYDARVGQFASEDPVGFGAGDSNTRRYVTNNAVNNVDPTGLQRKRPPFVVFYDPTDPQMVAGKESPLFDNATHKIGIHNHKELEGQLNKITNNGMNKLGTVVILDHGAGENGVFIQTLGDGGKKGAQEAKVLLTPKKMIKIFKPFLENDSKKRPVIFLGGCCQFAAKSCQ